VVENSNADDSLDETLGGQYLMVGSVNENYNYMNKIPSEGNFSEGGFPTNHPTPGLI